MKSDTGLLYIEPSADTSREPLIDRATRLMTAAFRRGLPGPAYRGFHICACGAMSSNRDYKLPNGDKTNSLCVHYLAYHRTEVPKSQLEKVMALGFGEATPDEGDLVSPHKKKGEGLEGLTFH